MARKPFRYNIFAGALCACLLLAPLSSALADAEPAPEETYSEPEYVEPVYTEPEPEYTEPEPEYTEPEYTEPEPAETDTGDTGTESSDPGTTEPEQTAEPDGSDSTESAESSDTPDSTPTPAPTEVPAGPDEMQNEEPEDEEDEEEESTAIYSGNPTITYDFEGVTGFDYTDIPALAAALDEIFAGHVNIYADAAHTEEVLAALGTFLVPNNDVLQYVGAYGDSSRSMIGTSCWIYGNGFYYTLFGDFVGNGSSYSAAYSENLYIQDISYQGFLDAGVRQQPGAVIRLGGDRHTVCVLTYDENSITIIDGNGDGVGGVAIREYSWNDFYLRAMSFGGISYTVQALDSWFDTLYPATVASGSCGDDAQWYLDVNGLLTVLGTGSINGDELADYRDQIISVSIADGITAIEEGTFKNCVNLESTEIPSSVTAVGYNAFTNTAVDEDVLTSLFETVEMLGTPPMSKDEVTTSTYLGEGKTEAANSFIAERYEPAGPSVTVNERMLADEKNPFMAERYDPVNDPVSIDSGALIAENAAFEGAARN